MARHLAQLLVRATARDEERFRDEDPRARFWRALENAATSRTQERSPSEYEAQLRNDFGPALTRRVVAHVSQGLAVLHGNEGPVAARPLALKSNVLERRIESLSTVFFQFKLRGYGSLDFSVEIAGIGHVARLLDNNFDLFMMLMEAYIPQSFYEVTPFGYPPDAISFAITADDQTREAFAESAAPRRAVMSGGGGFTRERAIMALVNGTLLVPALLALAVCYVTYKGLADERATMAANLQRLLAHEEAFMKQNNERLQGLQKIETQLIERGLQSPAPPAPAQSTPASEQQPKKTP